MTLARTSDTERLSVRLRSWESARLDRLVERFNADVGGRYRKPYSRGRNYSWQRGDVVRLALVELERAIAASDDRTAAGSSDDGDVVIV